MKQTTKLLETVSFNEERQRNFYAKMTKQQLIDILITKDKMEKLKLNKKPYFTDGGYKNE